jgi:hypothetical protein
MVDACFKALDDIDSMEYEFHVSNEHEHKQLSPGTTDIEVYLWMATIVNKSIRKIGTLIIRNRFQQPEYSEVKSRIRIKKSSIGLNRSKDSLTNPCLI